VTDFFSDRVKAVIRPCVQISAKKLFWNPRGKLLVRVRGADRVNALESMEDLCNIKTLTKTT